MNKLLILKVLHITYVGLLLIFIYFYFSYYKPFKLHTVCAEASAKTVLAAKSQYDPHDYYLNLYQSCLSSY